MRTHERTAGGNAMMDYANPDGSMAVSGASRVGAELAAARERLGWQLPDIAGTLRIRLPFLVAIEAGRMGDLPGHAYALGFVRTYATALGLDADEVARRFRNETQDTTRKTELTFPAPVPQRGVPAMAVVLMGIVVAAGAYIGWYRYTGSNDAAEATIASAPPERLAALAPVPSVSPQVASILPSAPPPGAAAANAAASIPAILPPPRPAPPVVTPVIAPPAPVALPPPPVTRVVLHAKAGGWVQVREKQGPVLLNRVLHTGESWPVPMEPKLLLTTSNAGGMELLIDGIAAPSLGAVGAMRRDVPLDPATITSGKPKP